MIYNEERLIQHLKRDLIPDLVKSRSKISRWDCYSPIFKMRIELKCRRKHYDELVIEKSKYEALIKKAEENGDIPIYICSTPKGIWAFSLNSIQPPEWKSKSMPRQTDFSRREFIKKEVGFLHLCQGIELHLFEE